MKHLLPMIFAVLLLGGCGSTTLIGSAKSRPIKAPDPIDGGKTEFSQTEDSTSTPAPVGYSINYHPSYVLTMPPTTQPSGFAYTTPFPPSPVFPPIPAAVPATTSRVVTTGRAVQPQNAATPAKVSKDGAETGGSFQPQGSGAPVLTVQDSNSLQMLVMFNQIVCGILIAVGALSILAKILIPIIGGYFPVILPIAKRVPAIPLTESVLLIAAGAVGLVFTAYVEIHPWLMLLSIPAIAWFGWRWYSHHQMLMKTPPPTPAPPASAAPITMPPSIIIPSAAGVLENVQFTPRTYPIPTDLPKA